MSTHTETRKPYELLVRWDKDGKLAGAHIGFITRSFKDGIESSHLIEPVQPVAVGTSAGFPLADILGQLEIDALTGRDAANTERDLVKAKNEELKARFDQAVSEIEARKTADAKAAQAKAKAEAEAQAKAEAEAAKLPLTEEQIIDAQVEEKLAAHYQAELEAKRALLIDARVKIELEKP